MGRVFLCGEVVDSSKRFREPARRASSDELILLGWNQGKVLIKDTSEEGMLCRHCL